ncbi:hypothetical protein H5410_030095, partial [Solanum commersonii]
TRTYNKLTDKDVKGNQTNVILKVHRQMSNGSVIKAMSNIQMYMLKYTNEKITISNIGCPSLLMYEPNKTHSKKFKRLGMNYVNYNSNGQIWVFVKDPVQVGVVSDTNQQLTLHIILHDG